MTIMQAIFLGALQGATEFLPVSSSAHLVAGQAFLHVESSPLAVGVALHFGTLLAILAVLWRSVLGLARDFFVGSARLLAGSGVASALERAPLFPVAVAIIIGTVPAGAAGVLLEGTIERAFSSPAVAGACLMVTGLVLVASRFAPAARVDRVGPGRGLVIGLAQALALLPGISRSGITIVAGYFVGLERGTAAKFSFLLAAPAIAGAATFELWHGLGAAGEAPRVEAGPLVLGVLSSAAVGAACLLVLLRLVERGRLHWFAAYCLPAGALMLAGHYLL